MTFRYSPKRLLFTSGYHSALWGTTITYLDDIATIRNDQGQRDQYRSISVWMFNVRIWPILAYLFQNHNVRYLELVRTINLTAALNSTLMKVVSGGMSLVPWSNSYYPGL